MKKKLLSYLKTDKLPSISRRLTRSLTIAVVIVSAVVITMNYYSNSRKAKAQLDETADEYFSFLLESLRFPLWAIDIETIQHIGSVYSRNDHISELKIIGSDDVVYFSAKKNDTGYQVSRKKDILYDGRFAGAVQLSLSAQTYYAAQRQLLTQSLIAIFGVLFVITGITGFLLRAYLRKPLIHLSKIIEAYTSGASEIPSQHTTCEEFQPIINVLSEMNEKLIKQMSEIQKAEEKYRSIFENAVEGIFQSTPEDQFATANPTLARIFGYDSPEDLMSHVKNIGTQIYVDPNRRKDFFRLLKKNKVIKEFESEFYRKDGSIAVISENAREVRDNENNIVLFEGSIEDVTDRKMAEQSLKESHETLLTILDSIDATIYVADIETNEILFMNKYMKKSFGYNLEGKICYQEFRKEREPCQDCTNPKLLDSEGNPTGVYVWEGQNPITERWYINYDRAVKWMDGRMVRLEVATDITDLKRAEEEKRNLKSQLLRAEKLESIGTLAGGIAHDFNNLLMGIQGRISLMLVDMDSSHPHSEHLKGIEDSVLSATDLTKQLLGFARGGKYEVKVTNINDLLRKSSEMFGRTKKEVVIHPKYQEDLWPVEVDRGQIEQILMNLYVNAWQAMPGGGDLYLESENVFLDEKLLGSYDLKSGKYVRITVTDTGIGMDQATQEKIFDPFFTTKEMGRGTGLGLATAYGVIKNHNGIINVESDKGRGAIFIIYLPASEKEVQVEKKSSIDIIKGSETILLVDDEDSIIEVSGMMLNKLGYKVLTAKSGKEALQTYQSENNSIAIVIIDMIMPLMGGGETYDRLKKMDPELKALLASGYSIDGQAREILNRGCDGFIQKPFDIADLSTKLREIIDV